MRFASILLSLLSLLLSVEPASSQSAVTVAGVDFLVQSQREDGSWESPRVRPEQATAEAVQTVLDVGQEPAVLFAGSNFLEAAPTLDTDDRARRIRALLILRDVSELTARLRADVHPEGGWGLTAELSADPLDTALVLRGSNAVVRDGLLEPAVRYLLLAQREDGGWPCTGSLGTEVESEVFCTSHALLGLLRQRFQLSTDREIAAGAAFLRSHLQPNGAFGPPGPDQIVHTALASLALARVPAFGPEVPAVKAFLEGSQQADGSWDGDPYATALVLRALAAMRFVRFCGDGSTDPPAEACDGMDLEGQTCEDLGFGPGTLTCSAQCTFDTSECTAPPVCGDDLRNRPEEVCDGTDLGGQSCDSVGFASGDLACAEDCTAFDVLDCLEAPTCGDGVVNQPGEICDLSDLGGATCSSLGLGSGPLRCGADCAYDVSACDAAGSVLDHKGRDLVVGFLRNFDDRFRAFPTSAELHLTSDEPTVATIRHPVEDSTFAVSVPVEPGQVTVVPLPDAVHDAWPPAQIRSNAVRISAPEELTVYLINRQAFTSDAALGLPVETLGTSYVVMASSPTGFLDRTQFLIVAPFDDTRVTITPTDFLQLAEPGTFQNPGAPLRIELRRGEGFRGQAAFSGRDLTGTRIQANRPVAVFHGNVCTNVPSTQPTCDHLFEMAPPVSRWGSSALLTNLPDRPAGSSYRVVAAEDGTEITLDGLAQAVLDRGDHLEIGPLTGRHVLTGSEPISVTQLLTGGTSPGATTGDPSMVHVVPSDQFLESYTISTVGGGQFDEHFLVLTAPTSSVGSVLLDGEPLEPTEFSPIGDSDFSSAVVSLEEGTHTTASSAPHGLVVGGFNFADSYLYPGGTRLELTHPFCGDGVLDPSTEECDLQAFGGKSCASFGFASGFLGCTVDCRIDASECSGFTLQDLDDDGSPATEDCDDLDPEVNPAQSEIFSNGVDDDCNPATPDEVPEGALSCRLFSDQRVYTAVDLVALDGDIANHDPALSLPGLTALLEIEHEAGSEVVSEGRELAPLPSGARVRQYFVASATEWEPGTYEARLVVRAGDSEVAQCGAGFRVESTTANGAGLEGRLLVEPDQVDPGEFTEALFTLHHQGNASLEDLQIRVVVVDPASGAVVGVVHDQASLDPGETYAGSRTLVTDGLAASTSHPVILLARPSGSPAELTLDSAVLTVVNAPPDCSDSFATPDRLWPPNHKWIDVELGGVTDPDGDPVTVAVHTVLQDERTDDAGSGETCPDAEALGASSARLRAERSGRQDGRVYHVLFTADDGRGGVCEGEVTVCVPHDRNGVCGDQGGRVESAGCRADE